MVNGKEFFKFFILPMILVIVFLILGAIFSVDPFQLNTIQFGLMAGSAYLVLAMLWNVNYFITRLCGICFSFLLCMVATGVL